MMDQIMLSAVILIVFIAMFFLVGEVGKHNRYRQLGRQFTELFDGLKPPDNEEDINITRDRILYELTRRERLCADAQSRLKVIINRQRYVYPTSEDWSRRVATEHSYHEAKAGLLVARTLAKQFGYLPKETRLNDSSRPRLISVV